MSIDAVLSLFCMLYIQNLFHSTPAPHIQKALKIVKYLNVLLVVYAEKYPRYFTLYWYHTSPCCVLQTVVPLQHLLSIFWHVLRTANDFSPYCAAERIFILTHGKLISFGLEEEVEGGTGSFTISHIYNLVISIFIKRILIYKLWETALCGLTVITQKFIHCVYCRYL